MGVFSDYARKFWENGFSVIPVEGKRPPVTGWNKYIDELPSEADIAQWEHEFANCGIGLVTGPASGIAVIDIDSTDESVIQACRKNLPPSPLIKRGKKGFSLFVKWSNQTGGAIKLREHKIGDFIVRGQTVIPPSIHPDISEPYKWMALGTLEDDKAEILNELPPFTDADHAQFERKILGIEFISTENAPPQNEGRNNRLKAIAGSLFKDGLGADQVWKILYQKDIELHGDKALFSDSSETKYAKHPKAAALIFANGIYKRYLENRVLKNLTIPQLQDKSDESDDSEYSLYRDFFDQKLKLAKKDLISGQLLRKEGDVWQPVLSRLDAIKSYAICEGLKAHQVLPHLDRYIMRKKPILLIDVVKWDGVDRINKLKEFIKIKNQEFSVFENAMKEWGANIFRRLYQSNAQNRCIILKGNQGIGKDHLLKSMFQAFGPYYDSFTSNRDEREAWSQVTSKLVLHIEEFDQTGQMSVAFLKDLITRGFSTYRAPYDRAAITRKCIGSFISTVNIDAVLRDETGNRRFAVFEVENIDWNYPKDWSEQMVAQFKELYEQNYVAPQETWAAVTTGNAQFEQVDMTQEVLSLWDSRLDELSTRYGCAHLDFGQVVAVTDDLRKLTGWTSRAVLSLLKVHNRSRHSKCGTRYFSSSRR